MLHFVMILALLVVPPVALAGFSLNDPAPAVAEGVTVSLATIPPKRLDSDVVVRVLPSAAESWIVSPSDGTLRRVLSKWAARAGWQIHWEAAVDLPVTVGASFEGDFRSAIKGLFSSLSASEVNLSALLYTGNRVLRVTESGQRAQ